MERVVLSARALVHRAGRERESTASRLVQRAARDASVDHGYAVSAENRGCRGNQTFVSAARKMQAVLVIDFERKFELTCDGHCLELGFVTEAGKREREREGEREREP